jgi:predicted dehydrogenase
VQTAETTGRQLHICHVLRYTSHFAKLREVIQSGVLGQIVNVHHRENVSWWHMAHSFVRGNWRNQAESSPMILAKCCHDLDILIWMLDDGCHILSSVGNLLHYLPKNAPEGAPERCLDGCPAADRCPYYAPFIYVDHIPLWRNIGASAKGLEGWATRMQLRSPELIKALSNAIPTLKKLSNYRGWPSAVLTNDPTPKNVMAALREGPYGRCVYHCDNDVVDHQVVNMQFESGTSVTLTMHGHSHEEGRSTLIEGSRGRLYAEFQLGGSWIEVDEHLSDWHTRHETHLSAESGHGGGDFGLIAAFVKALQSQNESVGLTSARNSLESHLMAFAAEDARLNEKVVRMDDYRL